MSWIFLAISAHFFWALTSIGDKYVVVDRMKHEYVYITIALMLGISSLLLAPFIEFSRPQVTTLLLLFLGCSLRFVSNFCYIKALKIEDPARVNILWGLVPIFSLAIAWFTINENLSGLEMTAVAFLVIATLTDSIHLDKKAVKFSKAFFLMAVACLVYAGYAVILKHVTQTMPFAETFVWNGVMTFMVGAMIPTFSPKFKRDLVHEVRTMDKQLFGIIFAIAMLSNVAVLLNIRAVSLGPTALVYAMEGFQTMFVFILTIVITKFTHLDLKESKNELNRKNILIKVGALALMLVGISIINLA